MTAPDDTELASRRVELEQAVFRRVRQIVADQPHSEDPEYLEGLRTAIRAILDSIMREDELGEVHDALPAVLRQTRRDARAGMRLEVVLRRYFAGYALLSEFARYGTGPVDSAPDDAMRRPHKVQALCLDNLIAAVAEEHRRETERMRRSPVQRRAQVVRQLLAEEPCDGLDADYDLNGWHLGLIVRGASSDKAVWALANALDRSLLSVPQGDGTV